MRTRLGRDNVLDATGMANRDPGGHVTESTTVGWEPNCKCRPMVHCNIGVGEVESLEPYSPIPCTVLDPFAGSGTTLQVARWLGRRGMGIELSQEYCEMAIKRIQQPRKRMSVVEPSADQMHLF